MLGGFAHDLDELGQCQPEELIAVEVTALPIGTVGDRLGAASARCRSRTRSSGRIEGTGNGRNLVPEIMAEVLIGAQLNLATEG